MITKTNDTLFTAREVFDTEIIELQRVKEKLSDDFEKAVNSIYSCTGKVIVTGIGKSGIIGHKIAASLASTGTHSFFMNSAEGLHGDLGMINENDIVLIISNSGNSPEVLQILPSIREIGAYIIAMTGGLNSSLAKNSDIVLDIGIEKEACPLNLAPTSSTTATLVMGDALTVALIKLRNFKAENFAVYHPGGSLGKRLLTKVSDVMHTGKDMPLIDENDRFDTIIYEISNKRLGMTCVMSNNKIVGIITDGDIRRQLLEKGELFNTTAKSIMTKNFKYISPENFAVDALRKMESANHKINCLPVIANSELIGVITVHDLLDFR
ncbi:KpsF/GutQ family sugar-phosphate isomerase [Priestia aryabhattai]|uniref:KpsF/GutQ family sugar-phosphate isomerase n=1 Tax=Priestia aryabhattai TaxID=412384 RepID=UPI000532E673|nr:KpsF/GutQ family sugar-phosphate isomerase [Priestia aryabhattai]